MTPARKQPFVGATGGRPNCSEPSFVGMTLAVALFTAYTQERAQDPPLRPNPFGGTRGQAALVPVVLGSPVWDKGACPLVIDPPFDVPRLFVSINKSHPFVGRTAGRATSRRRKKIMNHAKIFLDENKTPY